jgi:hypothetical protein
VVLENAALDVGVQSKDSADASLLVTLTNGPTINGRGSVAFAPDTSHLVMSDLRIGLVDHEWRTAAPFRVRWWGDSGSFALDTIRLVGNRGGVVTLAGVVPADAPVAARLTADSVALADLATLGQSSMQLAGTIGLDLSMTGTAAAPILDVTGRLDGTKVGEVTLERTTFNGHYENRRFLGGLGVLRNDTTVLNVVANLPLDLAIESRSRRLLDDTLRVSVISRNVDLALIESFTPSLSGAHGRLNATLSLTGRPDKRSYEGFLRVDSAGAFVTDLGIRVRDVFADIVAQGDTIDIRRISMVSGDESRDSLWIRGALSLADVEDPSFDVTLGARDFHVIDKRRVGDLHISAGLRFQGRQSASELSGNVVVNSGYVVIPPLTSKDVISLDDPDLYSVVDTSLAANRSLLPKAPPAIVRGMTIRTQVTMGSDVRLRSEEANIKLGGSVNVVVGRGLGASGAPQLALEGALRTERGTFLMRFGDGFLSRLFTIEGGQVRFLGDADFNPDLDIGAIYTVRIASSRFATRSDVRIRARLLGTLVQPRIVIESADELRISDSDLISYLITGRPSAEIGGLNYAGDFLLSSLSSNVSARFSGRFFDYVQLQTASGGLGVGATAASTGAFSSMLQGSQLGVGKQLNNRTFVNLTAGLCQLGNQLGFVQTQSSTTLADAFGVSVEYAISRNLGVSVSREPPQQAAYTCVPTLMGFTATQPQWSLDFFRVWRW